MVCKLVQSRSNVRYLHVYTRSIPDIVQSSIIYVIINLHRNPKSYGGECKRYTANRFGLNLSLSLPLPRPWTWESVRREVHRKLDRWSVSSLGGIAIDHRMIHRRTLDVIQYKRGTSLSLSLSPGQTYLLPAAIIYYSSAHVHVSIPANLYPLKRHHCAKRCSISTNVFLKDQSNLPSPLLSKFV